LAAERAELETARAAMTRGRWGEAEAALNRHAAAFPEGQLAEERANLFVVLLAEQGRIAEARAAESRFEREYPASLFAAAARAAIDSMTEGVDAGQVVGEPKGR
jgi:TolA-binding protein